MSNMDGYEMFKESVRKTLGFTVAEVEKYEKIIRLKFLAGRSVDDAVMSIRHEIQRFKIF